MPARGGGTNESIENPLGTVITIFVVVAPAFSVGHREAVELELARQGHRRTDPRVGGRGRGQGKRR